MYFKSIKLNENILKHCNNLKVISRHGVGYDNVDLPFIKKKYYIIITATATAVAVAERNYIWCYQYQKALTNMVMKLD